MERKPNAVFAIVGKNPGLAVKQLANRPGIRLVGEVPDVRPYLAESRFSIAPLQIARGTQNKVLEAMAMGKPVIASPAALEGLAVEISRNGFAATSPEEWVGTIAKLYENDQLVREIGISARKSVKGALAWSKCLDPLESLLQVPEARKCKSAFQSMQAEASSSIEQ